MNPEVIFTNMRQYYSWIKDILRSQNSEWVSASTSDEIHSLPASMQTRHTTNMKIYLHRMYYYLIYSKRCNIHSWILKWYLQIYDNIIHESRTFWEIKIMNVFQHQPLMKFIHEPASMQVEHTTKQRLFVNLQKMYFDMFNNTFKLGYASLTNSETNRLYRVTIYKGHIYA